MKTQPSMKAVLAPSSERRPIVTISCHSDFIFENHPSIVVASKIVISPGSKVHRIVLRKDGEEYITHQENVILDGNIWKHGDFYWGHYFQGDMDKATADFIERSAKL